jgi:hypothetical protein
MFWEARSVSQSSLIPEGPAEASRKSEACLVKNTVFPPCSARGSNADRTLATASNFPATKSIMLLVHAPRDHPMRLVMRRRVRPLAISSSHDGEP